MTWQRFHRMLCWLLGHRWHILMWMPVKADTIVTVVGCGRGECGARDEVVTDLDDLFKRYGHPSGNARNN